jgi:peptidyl-prolyl cis-trans isomerase SurA
MINESVFSMTQIKQMTKIHPLFTILLYSLLISSLLLFVHPSYAKTAKQEESLDNIVAVINDMVITQTELNEVIDRTKKQMAATNTPIPPEAALHKQVLDQLINRKLQMQIAEQAGVKVSDTEVDNAIKKIAAQNKLSVTELYEQVTKQGMTQADYRKELREEILLQQVQQQAVGPHITITPQEVDDFMHSATWRAYNDKEYHLEDILITLPNTPSSQDIEKAKKQADMILVKLQHGASFQELAAAESGDSGALQGGDLGWRQLPQIPPAFAEQLIHKKENALIGPVQTPNGFHIVKLVGIRNTGKTTDAASQRKQVEQLLYQRKLEEGLQNWITKLRGEAFININPESSS